MAVTEHLLSVDWQLRQPPLLARAWHYWGDSAAAHAGHAAGPSPALAGSGLAGSGLAGSGLEGSSSDLDLEARLGWSEGTLEVLRQAFALRLGRATGWESLSDSVLAAAGVFRRGVAARRPNSEVASVNEHGNYQIQISSQQPDLPPTGVFTIMDGNVARHWPACVPVGQTLVLTLDEHSKTLESVALIISAAKAGGFSKSKLWRVIGGGLLTDVAAFAAAVVGAQIEFVPTTLLAMADACVGGKTGVNFAPYGKNQIGRFYFPSVVHVWAGWLATLPPRELLAGGAECLKHAFLSGDLALARSLAQALARQDWQELTPLLPAIIRFKVEVVTEDPGESGRRAILNFGHTLAHALESLSQGRVSGELTLNHGEAVGLGIVFALLLSRRFGGLAEADTQELLNILRESGCVVSEENLRQRLGVADLADATVLSELKKFIANDKKNLGGDVTVADWILLQAPGQVKCPSPDHWTVPLPLNVVDLVWPEFLRVICTSPRLEND